MTLGARPAFERRAARRSAMVLTTALALTSIGACGGGDDRTDVTRIVISTAADGSRATIADFAGTPVVVNMWATWCAACVREMPAFDQVAKERGDAVRIIGVNVGDSAADAIDYATDLGVTFPQYTDPDGELSAALSVTGLPATAFVSATGRVLFVHEGALTADELRSTITEQFSAKVVNG